MASRVYDEVYAEYGRRPTEEEVILRLEHKLGRNPEALPRQVREAAGRKSRPKGPP